MKNAMFKLAAATLAATAMAQASAAVTVTFGSGTATPTYTNSATFEHNTSVANNYLENGLLFSFVGNANNNGCGYAGTDCYDNPSNIDISSAFSGNYMATASVNNSNSPGYISIKRADGKDILGLEMAVASGHYASPSVFGYWQTFENGTLTGSGGFTKSASGTILGLADATGFSEVRYYAFRAAGITDVTAYSAPDIDNVRVLSAVPEASTWAMLMAGLTGMFFLRRKQAK